MDWNMDSFLDSLGEGPASYPGPFVTRKKKDIKQPLTFFAALCVEAEILDYVCSTGFCKLVVSCKMQMQSSLVSYSNNRVIRWVWNNANLIYLNGG